MRFIKLLVIGLFLCAGQFLNAQDHQFLLNVQNFQKDLNEHYADPEDSPLEEEDRLVFEGHEFFDIDLNYRIEARFIRTPNQEPFEMMTTGERRPVYEKYGEAHFEVDGVPCVLEIYQSHRLREMEEHKDHLFLPFKDYTNGESSYGGGRYIDLSIPESDTIILDFNQAYNPYCAYSYGYSCPLVPEANHLEVAIPAGVKKWDH